MTFKQGNLAVGQSTAVALPDIAVPPPRSFSELRDRLYEQHPESRDRVAEKRAALREDLEERDS